MRFFNKLKRNIIIMGALSIFASGVVLAEDSLGYDKVELLIDSPYALVGADVVMIDKDNADVAPVVIEDRTLVPVRFISESFGMDVLWDENEKKVSLINEYYNIEIVIGEKQYKSNDDVKSLDVPAMVINERTMLPLRAMAETIGKSVYWDDGYICISNEMFDEHSKTESRKWQMTVGSNEYGVRFKVIEDEDTDYYSGCERLGAADGLNVVAENPDTEGSSDFDIHYPWSEMKLCSIERDKEGKIIKTYLNSKEKTESKFVFVEIPKYYMKRYIEDGYEYRYISEKKKDGYIIDPSFVENGKELDYIYVSAYEGGDWEGKLVSGTELYPMTEKTRPEFTVLAKQHGEGFGILDIRTLMTLQNLYLIEFAEKDSQKAVGNGWSMCNQPYKDYASVMTEKKTNRVIINNPGQTYIDRYFEGCTFLIVSATDDKVLYQRTITDIVINEEKEGTVSIYFDGDPVDINTQMYVGSGAQKTGTTDGLQYHTGRTDGHGGEYQYLYRTGVKYRNMENLWGNVWHYIDGINIEKGKTLFATDMNRYNVASVGYKTHNINQKFQADNGNVGGNKEIHYLKNLGYDENYPWLALPMDYMNEGVEELDGASEELRNGNFGDYYYFKSEYTTNYVHGGGFDHYWRCGLFTLRGWQNDLKSWYLYGTRLIYKNV